MNSSHTMRGRLAARTLTVALACVVMGPPSGAHAQTPPTTDPSASAPFTPDIAAGQLGWLRLRVVASPGDTISVTERTADGAAEPVARFVLDGPAGGRAHLAPWRCDRRSRRFTVTAEGESHPPQSVPIDVASPSCADRVQLRLVTRRPAARRRLTFVARDRWRNGQRLPLRLCLQRSGDGASACRAADLSPTVPSRTLGVTVRRGGRYAVQLRGPQGVLVRRTVRVAARARGLRLLATGDSEIQILDSLIAARLRGVGVRVTSDAHIGTGISKLFQLNWLQHAATSARTGRPDVTVVFLGANDGYPIGHAACCGPAWSRGYGLRAARMMREYVRAGAGRVFWYLLPRPRPAGYASVFAAVNRGLRLAAAAVPGVRLLDLGPTVTPGGAFHQTVRYRGRTVNVRQPDGIHLSVGGDRIALDLLVAAMRSDGSL